MDRISIQDRKCIFSSEHSFSVHYGKKYYYIERRDFKSIGVYKYENWAKAGELSCQESDLQSVIKESTKHIVVLNKFKLIHIFSKSTFKVVKKITLINEKPMSLLSFSRNSLILKTNNGTPQLFKFNVKSLRWANVGLGWVSFRDLLRCQEEQDLYAARMEFQVLFLDMPKNVVLEEESYRFNQKISAIKQYRRWNYLVSFSFASSQEISIIDRKKQTIRSIPVQVYRPETCFYSLNLIHDRALIIGKRNGPGYLQKGARLKLVNLESGEVSKVLQEFEIGVSLVTGIVVKQMKNGQFKVFEKMMKEGQWLFTEFCILPGFGPPNNRKINGEYEP